MAMLGYIAIILVLAALAGVVILVLAGRKHEPTSAHPTRDPRLEAQAHYDAMQRGAENQRNNSAGSADHIN